MSLWRLIVQLYTLYISCSCLFRYDTCPFKTIESPPLKQSRLEPTLHVITLHHVVSAPPALEFWWSPGYISNLARLQGRLGPHNMYQFSVHITLNVFKIFVAVGRPALCFGYCEYDLSKPIVQREGCLPSLLAQVLPNPKPLNPPS